MLNPKYVFSLIILFFLFLCVRNSFAEIPDDRIKPFIYIKEVYNSNVFRVKDGEYLKNLIGDDKLSDFMTIVTVGAGLNYQISRQEFDILLRKDFQRYDHYSTQNIEQDEINGKLFLRALDRISVKIDGGYTKLLEPRENYRAQQKIERITKSGDIAFGYDMPFGLSIHAAFRSEDIDFSVSELDSRERTERSYSGVLSYSAPIDTTFNLVYEKHDFDYKLPQNTGGRWVNNDSMGDTIKVGFSRNLGCKTSLSLNVGYLWRRFEEFSGRDFQGTIGKAEVNYHITEKLISYFTIEKKIYEALFLDYIYSVNESAGLGAMYKPTAKVEVFVHGSILKKRYKGDSDIISATFSQREDKLKELRAGIVWSPFRRFSVNMFYRYETKYSNFEVYDFRVYETELGMSYKF